MDRMDMYNQMYARGDEVSSGRRPGTTGPNVQRNMPGRMTGVADKVLTGSGRPPVGTMATPKPSSLTLPAKTLSRMRGLASLGKPGLIAAGGLGLFEIGRQGGFSPENLGKNAAMVGKVYGDLLDEAVEVAKELGQPIQDFVDRVVAGYQSEMDSGGMMSDMDESGRTMSNMERNMMQQEQMFFPKDENMLRSIASGNIVGKEFSDMERQQALEELSDLQTRGFAEGDEVSKFPDLTGDGKVTQADILKGRGVFQEGGAVEGEIDKGLEELQGVAPEAMVIQQVMTMVMEMMQSGASEEQIVAALKEMGLDEEDIQQVMMMVAEQMAGQESIDGQLAQMM
jgi:hypothetical protein